MTEKLSDKKLELLKQCDGLHDNLTQLFECESCSVLFDNYDDVRICTICNNPLDMDCNEKIQSGWYCCDNYYCSEKCLNKSLDNETWLEHYDDDGDCYWTEWEL